MKRINLLDIETTNKIAAGEVVERPSSVAKELIENSIDAEAKNIIVEIQDGGESLIKVIDDGNGIHPEDVEKAFYPHATSKISTIEDIYKISTLGFRGEALASIASVSKVTLKSKVEDNYDGREIYIEGGEIKHLISVGLNKGTQIEVRDLFYNVPARKKFMKSPMREAGAISDIVSRIALSNPDLSFKLYNNGKNIIHTYGNGKVSDVIRSIYGKQVSENLIYFEKHYDIVSVHGYIGNAEISRGSRNNQTIFVNNRYIKNKLISVAIENAFKSFITINKYPFFVINIDIFPEFVDVNIHPTKSEIKFNDEKIIYKIVFEGVHEALREYLKDSFTIPESDSSYVPQDNFEILNFDTLKSNKQEPINPMFNYEKALYEKTLNEGVDKEDTNVVKENFYKVNESVIKEAYADKSDTISCSSRHETLSIPEEVKIAKIPELNVIGQYNKTYILCEKEGDLYIIDQHAAHEKILFEKYRNQIIKSSVVIQPLLVPSVVELSLEDYFYYSENITIFDKIGFQIEDFGNNTICIKEAPYILGKLDFNNFFISILDNLKNMGSGKTEDVKYAAIAKLACKAAIKAQDSLDVAEMRHLLNELRYIDDPFNCPHGRPVIIKITSYEMDKKFKRIQ
ncbi:DNA mismatch repair endonuclease MutL [Desnuesiella massiliensis]|uniref:DNA mismatch repair endonuclease MutL n=1 Tax=Desnuesiella massiliensis TaxID=1650662 RepID=UPI0006E352CB|nr:DNA mismatch repair endonuclease MutL [Desnuesiella massiliensis]